MTEENKKKLIDKICTYGRLKQELGTYLETKEFEKFHKTEKEKDKILSEIVNSIKDL